MKHASMKTRDDVLTTDPAASFAKFRSALGKLIALPKTATPPTPKPRPKTKRKPAA